MRDGVDYNGRRLLDIKIVVTPSRAVVRRARQLGWTQVVSGLMDSERRALLCRKKEPFSPIRYLGTVTIRSHKIRDGLTYALGDQGPVFSGDLVKMAIKVLGKKRVRIFLHRRKGDDIWEQVLLFGTKEGTVGIAPRVSMRENVSPLDEDTKMLKDFMKGMTSKFLRSLVYEQI